MRPDRAVRAARPVLTGATRPRSRRFGWERAYRERLERGDPVGAAEVVERRAPKRKGASSSVLGAHSAAAARILDEAASSPLIRRDWAHRLALPASTTHRALAASLLPGLWDSYAPEVERLLEALAQDEDWVTREDGAAAMGTILDRHFVAFLPRVARWLASPRSGRLRRAAIVASKLAARSRGPDRVERLLDALEPALRDPDPYVRKNLGPFAIGDGFLRAYPEATLARLARWAEDPDENVRWNVAMAFTSAAARRHQAEGRRILARLRDGDRVAVLRAVASAKKNLARKP